MHTLQPQTVALTAPSAAAQCHCLKPQCVQTAHTPAALSYVQPHICHMLHSSNRTCFIRHDSKRTVLYNAGDTAVSRKRESHGRFVAWPVLLDCYFCGQLRSISAGFGARLSNSRGLAVCSASCEGAVQQASACSTAS